MNVEKLTFYGMPFNLNLNHNWNGYFISEIDKNGQSIKKMSCYSFDLIHEIAIKYNVYSCLEECIFLYHSSDKIIKRLDVRSFTLETLGGIIFPKYFWKDCKAFHNLLSRNYEIYSLEQEKLFEFKHENTFSFLFYSFGILKYFKKEKSNNWIARVQPNNGYEIWRKEFDWEITRVESHGKYIILNYSAYENIRHISGGDKQIDWYHPNYYTICIDGATGTEIWKTTGTFININRQMDTVLITDATKKEIEIASGKIISMINESPRNSNGAIPFFSDEEFIYYLTNNDEFGRYDKFTGEISWEFNLIDEHGEKRNLTNWLLLGNGNLVLQTLPNHPNGDFTCIFNPKENMEYSNVKDGVRLNAKQP